MPMSREEHETLLSELLGVEVEQSRKTEILQLLRNDYTSVHTDFDTMTKTNGKLKQDNDDLIVSNSKLFRQTGVYGEPQHKEEEKTKEFSETISIEAIEKGI